MFQTEDDEILVNEAPRPHNSGHSIEEAYTSQFDLRAILNLPGNESKVAGIMVNLVGGFTGNVVYEHGKKILGWTGLHHIFTVKK
jgi:phosphoribosylaminoimidazole carboxylase (NCAIR synthetase)